MKWRLHILSLEIRKAMAYRTDFWIQFACNLGVHVGIAYFLWKSIFEFNNVREMGGYSFESLIFYFFLVPFISRLTHAQEESGVAKEIYDGSFNKYLIYPVDLITYKFMAHLGYASVTLLQLLLGLLLVFAFFDMPEASHLTLGNFLFFLPMAFLSSYIVFVMMFSIELVAFWADTVWSLVVMLRLTIQLFGGALIPIEMFPPSMRFLNDFLPFQYGVSVPLRVLLGKMTVPEILQAYVIGIAWAALATIIALNIQRRGLKGYSGVGI